MGVDEEELLKLIDALNKRVDAMELRGESISERAEAIIRHVEFLHETLIAITQAKSLGSAKILAQNVLMSMPKINPLH
ncbi:hypothetical protein EHS13_18750 [Paenibacillus psychroresistens]|uniref:Uncharacterized protein n=1 Tax=Paenibacillus psychroresistens TaxID=1778678 RepID=A0A6B8RM86_9BACL|nr:hypothetical protein [Paenibacillus psychroresistens]QGQ96772.1 hypothetical protein EHS13_18750 [Paenibacillus psychroresistens]